NSQSGNTVSSLGQIMGTPYFMSPEQCNGELVDARSDIYSLGITFYYLLAGTPPYEGKTPLSVLMQHSSNTPPKTLESLPDLKVPPEISALIRKMMSKSLAERYSSLQEPLQELESLGGALQPTPLFADNPTWAGESEWMPQGIDLPTQKVQIDSKTAKSNPEVLRPASNFLPTEKFPPSSSQNFQTTARSAIPPRGSNSAPQNSGAKRIGLSLLILLLPVVSIGIYKILLEKNNKPDRTHSQTGAQDATKQPEDEIEKEPPVIEEKTEATEASGITRKNLDSLKELHQKLKKKNLRLALIQDGSLLEKIRTLYTLYQQIQAGEISAESKEKQALLDEFTEEFDTIKKTTKRNNPTVHEFIFGSE
ncbi:MAG: hypothetical protein AABZ60_04370, partial [Planctomycetota bacterium]